MRRVVRESLSEEVTRAETEGIVRDRAQGRTQQVQRKRKQHVQRPWDWSELFRKQ